MKLNLWTLLALLLFPLAFLGGSIGPQMAVLGLTLGIFFGTLSLRKPTPGDATTTNPGL